MKKLLQALENGIVFVAKYIILTWRYIKTYCIRIICYVLAICAICSGYFIAQNKIEAFYKEEETVQASAKIDAEVKLQNAIEKKEQKIIADELARKEAERIEAERIEAERKEAERKEKERKEAERIAAEKKRAEEKERQRKREEAAKAEALRKEVIAAEKAKAAAEKKERARISWMIKAQEKVAQKENEEYKSLMPEAKVNLDVSTIYQKPELPNGCEVTALNSLLNYKGYCINKTVLSDMYLPMFPFYSVGKDEKRAGGDPNFYFAGNPRHKSNAYYCFAGPIVEAANKFLKDCGTEITAKDITGTNEQGLIEQLEAGNPVVVWGTLSMGNAFSFAPNAWIINENGDKHTPFLNLHCVVLHGYDDTFFYIADPLKGNVAYKRSTFMNAYKQIGSRAVIIS